MNTSEPKEPSFITILGRAFTIMEELLKSDKPLGVSELARLTGIPKANTFRIMKTLEELKAVSPKEDGYILGSKMIELGAGAKHNDEFMLVAKPYLQKLSKTCEETVNLGIMFQDYVLFIHTELAEQRSLVASLPPVTPLYCCSVGKIFLAYQTNKELEHYFKVHHPIKRTINTRTTKEALLQESEKIRRDGIAHDHEEYDYGLSCIAAPIFLGEKLAAGISLSGPTSRLQYKGYAFLEKELKATAEALSKEATLKKVVLPDLS
ncbi:IclR family transcriptional regulator [Acidaminococcus intestini]|uniref:IclR family transcriptional regulator n=1 Tax=Acidaminococcus intestini TaxID=187327 RepID=UPI0003376946|nr:IclR family transcriptional regulator [Acidaminococcus intestini]CDB96568.1 transcriptional regulator [Acidaminococcus intestini CAG:325]